MANGTTKTKSTKSMPSDDIRRSPAGHSLGLYAGGSRSLLESINAGFPYKSVINLQKMSGLPLTGIGKVIRVPARTLARRKAQGRLKPAESERLLRLALVLEKATHLHGGDIAAATRWLTSPCRGLGYETPIKMTKTEFGAREVEDLIGRLEHGVIT
jgi:putative toxin-antitoxin system antitoxin component (TIGR02293 family)